MITPEDARAAIAAKIAQSVRPKPLRPGSKTAAPASGAPASAAPAGSATLPSSAPVLTAPAEGEPGSLETSILAAIAEAVDVLVEDGEPDTEKAPAAAPPVPAGRKRTPPAPARPAAELRPARGEPAPVRPRQEPRPKEGEDIGDEIQRIIATYHRNRKDEPQD
jgi:hypothetical protein